MTALTLPLASAKILFRRQGARRSHGIGTVRAVRIHKTYGADAIPLVREDRYLLARDIRGVGFRTAHQLAAKLGIRKDSVLRTQAGISDALIEVVANRDCGRTTCSVELHRG